MSETGTPEQQGDTTPEEHQEILQEILAKANGSPLVAEHLLGEDARELPILSEEMIPRYVEMMREYLFPKQNI